MSHVVQQVQRTMLDNGLRVLIKEIRAAPVVTCWAWYGVGARNEQPGITGASHWVEHMLFKGTRHFAKGEIMRAVARLGGYLNGFTGDDYTVYFETLPSRHLELALRIEADRMTGGVFDPDEVAAERTVILAERSMAENDPGFLLHEEVAASAFRVHPYRWQVLGWRCDLEQMTREDLFAHYRTHYAPHNCVLVLAGDLDAAAALEAVRRGFGDIPRGAEPPPLRAAEPPQTGERRVMLRRPGAAARVHIAHHVPQVGHPDLPALIVCDAILGGAKPVSFGSGVSLGRSSRLYRALVQSGLASSVGCHLAPGRDPGLMHLRLMVRDGVAPQAAQQRLAQEVERLRVEPPAPQEVDKALRQVRAQYAYSADGVSSQASALGYYESARDYRHLEQLLDAIAQVTPEQVRAVAEKYLGEDNRTTGIFEPTEPAPEAAAPHAMAMPQVGARPAFASDGPRALPHLEELAAAGGVRLLVSENRRSPALVMRGSLKAGGAHETDDTTGLAHFTAVTLRRGAAARSADDIAEAVEAVGGQIGFWSSAERVSFAAKGLAADLPGLLEIIADCLRRPTFPPDQIELVRGEIITALKDEADTPRALTERDVHQLAYPPGHPYHRHPLGALETVARLTRDDLAAFHQRVYGPRTMILTLVGDITPARARDLVERYFGDWSAPAPARFEIPPAGSLPGGARRLRHLPHKSQADICLAYLAASRKDADFLPLHLADNILGRLGLMGRLGKRVRDEQGLAYYAFSSLEFTLGRGLWKMHAGVAPQEVDRALESIRVEIERLRREPPPADELADAKHNQVGGLALRLETNDGVADALHEIAYWDLGRDYLERYPDLIQAISAEQVMLAAARVTEADSALAIAGPYEEEARGS